MALYHLSGGISYTSGPMFYNDFMDRDFGADDNKQASIRAFDIVKERCIFLGEEGKITQVKIALRKVEEIARISFKQEVPARPAVPAIPAQEYVPARLILESD